MKKLSLILGALFLMLNFNTYSQVAINADGSAPDGSAMLDVQSADKGFLPPCMTTSEILAISIPAEGLTAYNTVTHKPVYFDGSEWLYYDGSSILSIGVYAYGGVVFYLDGSGGGLVCAVSDQDGGSGIQWYNGSYTTTGATGIVIGTGQANTTAIINNQGAGSYAATVCDNYTVGAHSDWFLPSENELNEMYQNKIIINTTSASNGGSAFASNYYWSSSEINDPMARAQDFNSPGNKFPDFKDIPFGVRAVRAF